MHHSKIGDSINSKDGQPTKVYCYIYQIKNTVNISLNSNFKMCKILKRPES